MTAALPDSAPRAAVVANPVKVDVKKLRALVAKAEARHGWKPSLWLATSPEDPGCGPAELARAEGVQLVLAAGGDGTVRAVGETLAGSEVALGVLPSGTGNLLARNLNLNALSLADAVEVAFGGKSRRIDLGRIELRRAEGASDEHGFLVMAGVGIDAQMVANTNPELKKRVGWLAYVDAIARSTRDRRRIRVRAQLDDAAPRTATVHSVLVGNCGLLPGNITLLPDAELDDGLFDVVALRPEGFFGWARVWTTLVWENGVLRRTSVGRQIIGLDRRVRPLRYWQGTRLVLELDEPDEVELDGDTFGEVTGFRAWVDPGALLVRVPAA